MSSHGDTPLGDTPDMSARKAWMGLLACAPAERLAQLWAELGAPPEHTELRAPETGAAMTRGRAGATGAAFSLGEMTVTRCSVRLGCGAVGHAYVQGRDKTKARIAALADALMQTGAAPRVEAGLLAPLRRERDAVRAARAAKAAATKVDFLTLMRGED